MGHACPVCETPQADAIHLANHLGFTAVARGGDHEAWLDEHVPGWSDLDEAALADRVVDHAEDADYPQVFEDTTGGAGGAGHGASHGHGHGHGEGDAGTSRKQETADLPVDVDLSALADGDTDGDAGDVLEEARELTRRRREDSETE